MLGPGQHEQIVDVPAHAVELVGDQRDRLGSLCRVVAEHLEVSADDRDRGAQLMGDVVEERPLRRERFVEAVEHAVELVAELGQLVVALDGNLTW